LVLVHYGNKRATSAAWVPATNGVVWEEVKFHLVRLIWLDTKSLPIKEKGEAHSAGISVEWLTCDQAFLFVSLK